MTDAPPSGINRRFLNVLRVVGVIEGISTLVLFFVAMPLKYFADLPMAVRIAGSIHGGLFVLLIVLFVLGRRRIPLSDELTVGGIIAAIIPFGPFVIERHLARVSDTGMVSDTGDVSESD